MFLSDVLVFVASKTTHNLVCRWNFAAYWTLGLSASFIMLLRVNIITSARVSALRYYSGFTNWTLNRTLYQNTLNHGYILHARSKHFLALYGYLRINITSSVKMFHFSWYKRFHYPLKHIHIKKHNYNNSYTRERHYACFGINCTGTFSRVMHMSHCDSYM